MGTLSYLVDTHAMLWWLFDSPRLSPAARAVIADQSHAIWVSSASAWEISTKHRLGRLPEASVLLQDFGGWLAKAGFVEMPISIHHAQRAGAWPQVHRDPFDRMLAAQAAHHNVALITSDPAFAAFGIRLLW